MKRKDTILKLFSIMFAISCMYVSWAYLWPAYIQSCNAKVTAHVNNIDDPNEGKRLEAIEARLNALEKGIIANDDNIRRVAVSMTKYIDMVHFEGKSE